ncbi:hypothetical protein SODG_000165 [Sodalis praecaptivus]
MTFFNVADILGVKRETIDIPRTDSDIRAYISLRALYIFKLDYLLFNFKNDFDNNRLTLRGNPHCQPICSTNDRFPLVKLKICLSLK